MSVIQNLPSMEELKEQETNSRSSPASNRSCTETANILSIRCKNTSAELHKDKFCSGGRGKCIKHGSSWYTPIEFVAFCGLASCKHWKKCIRSGGRKIQALIEEGILKPHATSCKCSAYDNPSDVQKVPKRRSEVQRKKIEELSEAVMKIFSELNECKETIKAITSRLDNK